MDISELIHVLETASEESGDLATVVLQDDYGAVYDVEQVHVSAEHGTVTLIAKDSGHFS
ncbi:hypothetical protein HOS57_gp42 [Streptomyces phage AbbeyMikolon]|uniref:Halobacterial output domain-containing protein n=1 Tax=Streptomyces phage AbbeyMikolon TaxID=2059880 RepID=A0A2H5BLE0_9CAUD|nr:hypothetical protein [Streptomyces ardesiacus]YP_009796764.1 hypothetical protein HOS57_gp42 [Streptomyces phage AbbeyMikolon]AUG87113.1 hypothetical protein SEA_ABBEYMIKOLON_42 [Streptomyces phage AbbeyMikolon]